jgi:hypothetical protein
MRAALDGLNFVLQDATVLDVELRPDDVTYDIPPESTNQIRPRFPEMSRSGYGGRDGFDCWVILTAPPGAAEDARQLVKTHLTTSGSSMRRIISGRK